MSNPLNDVYMMGIEGDTYKDLLEIAKRQNKGVGEIVSDALKQKIEDQKQLKESTQKKLLMEG